MCVHTNNINNELHGLTIGKIYPEHLVLNQDLQDYLNNEYHKKGVIFLSTSQWH